MNLSIEEQRMANEIAAAVRESLSAFVDVKIRDARDGAKIREQARVAITEALCAFHADEGIVVGNDIDIELDNNDPTRIAQGYMDLRLVPRTEAGRALHDGRESKPPIIRVAQTPEMVTAVAKKLYENGVGQFHVLYFEGGQFVVGYCPICEKAYYEAEIEEYNAPIYYCPKAHIMRAK